MRVSCVSLLIPPLPTTPTATTVRHHRIHPGKVHGSLARAGKVKNQTPKVEKKEKKKAKVQRGRAHKRELYVRRCVNVSKGTWDDVLGCAVLCGCLSCGGGGVCACVWSWVRCAVALRWVLLGVGPVVPVLPRRAGPARRHACVHISESGGAGVRGRGGAVVRGRGAGAGGRGAGAGGGDGGVRHLVPLSGGPQVGFKLSGCWLRITALRFGCFAPPRCAANSPASHPSHHHPDSHAATRCDNLPHPHPPLLASTFSHPFTHPRTHTHTPTHL